jgi:hypothetical protein
MTNTSGDISQRNSAIVAGIGYLIIFAAGIFANFAVLSRLVVPGDAAATAENIAASSGLFRVGIAGFLIMVIADAVVAWALYVLLKQVNRSLSLLAAWLRLVNATIFGIALYNLLRILPLLGGADYLRALETDQLHAQVMLLLNAFDYGWLIGLVFFGFHLLVLGYLVFKAGYIPRILGVLLVIASSGYLIDSFANFLLPSYADYETVFSMVVLVPALIAELAFPLWLLVKAGTLQRTE